MLLRRDDPSSVFYLGYSLFPIPSSTSRMYQAVVRGREVPSSHRLKVEAINSPATFIPYTDSTSHETRMNRGALLDDEDRNYPGVSLQATSRVRNGTEDRIRARLKVAHDVARGAWAEQSDRSEESRIGWGLT